jgi:hypothetical protein
MLECCQRYAQDEISPSSQTLVSRWMSGLVALLSRGARGERQGTRVEDKNIALTASYLYSTYLHELETRENISNLSR